MNDKSQAPISEPGWKLTQYFYDGRQPVVLRTGQSLDSLQRLVSNWKSSEIFPPKDFELIISPVNGWESVKGDRAYAIAWAISEGLLTPELGAAQIRAMIGKGVSHATTQE